MQNLTQESGSGKYGEYVNPSPDFSKYTNDLFYDNKVTWEATKEFFNDSTYGLNTSSTQEDNLKVFGIPWYLYPELSGRDLNIWDNNFSYISGSPRSRGQGIKNLIRQRILDSTVTVRAVSKDDDPYGNIYRQMNNLLGGVNQLLTFLTTKQWNNRESLHQGVENKQVTMYTDLITEETHNNVQYQLTNTVSENKLKHFGEMFSNMISSTIFGPFYNYGTEYGFKGVMGMGEGLFGGIFAFHHWSKMLTRETINLWRAGRQLMTTNFEFVTRASSVQTLDEFFLPVLFLTQVQQPNSIHVDTGQGGFKIVEQVPPVPIDLMIGNPSNPIIRLGKSIITNLKIEVFDYKYLDGKFETIGNLLKNSDAQTTQGIGVIKSLLGSSPTRVPTQQRISFDIEPIIPIVQFSDQISKQSNQSTAGSSQGV